MLRKGVGRELGVTATMWHDDGGTGVVVSRADRGIRKNLIWFGFTRAESLLTIFLTNSCETVSRIV